MNGPYRNIIDSDYVSNRHVHIRWEQTLIFLRKDKKCKIGLDIGDKSPMTEQLEQYFNCKFNNTNIDLDFDDLCGKYEIVTAFEIIEHLFNPLHFLIQVKNILNENGTLYLSTPKGKPYFLWSEDHYHEMREDRLRALIDRAGFSIIRKKEIRIHPLKFYFTGFRPLLRFFYDKHLLMELTHQ